MIFQAVFPFRIFCWGARIFTPSLQIRTLSGSLRQLPVDHDLNPWCNKIKVNCFWVLVIVGLEFVFVIIGWFFFLLKKKLSHFTVQFRVSSQLIDAENCSGVGWRERQLLTLPLMKETDTWSLPKTGWLKWSLRSFPTILWFYNYNSYFSSIPFLTLDQKVAVAGHSCLGG